MFESLYIENLALIEKAALVWQPGLNVLSGETGAGKSMLLDAVALLLGGRAGKEQVRRGAERCRVQGVFGPPFGAGLLAELRELGLLAEDTAAEDDLAAEGLILSREVSAAGRSVCRINMQPVTLAALKQIGRLLINIHGQSEHILLLEPARQLALLDSFAGEEAIAQKQATGAVYRQWQQARQELERARQEDADDEQRRQFLQFQIEELSNAKLREGELEELAQEAAGLESVQKRSDYAGRAYGALYGGNNALVGVLDGAVRDLEGLSALDETVGPLYERLQGLYYELEDAALEVRDYKDRIVDDPVRLEEIYNRQFALKALCKKYNGDEGRLLQILQEAEQELERRENREDYLAGLELAEKQLAEKWRQAAARLSELRARAAEELGRRITGELHYLQMPKAHFQVELVEKAPAADGGDEVRFMICPNTGEELKPVAKIASGGEMSRIMLAIKVILASLDEVSCLIFDEIDTGLGGRALVSVAEKLVQVAASTQAICVTHAPVLAAYANNNLLVEKRELEGRTVTGVQELAGEAKVLEICRMLAGDRVSAATRRQAEELIEAGQGLSGKNNGKNRA